MYNTNFKTKLYDSQLLWCTICLLAIGLVMITSSSIPIAYHIYGDMFLFTKKQILHLIILFFIFKKILNIPICFWKKHNTIILLFSISMLLLVLVIGHSANGSLRWIKISYITIQPSELFKLAIFLYLSSYLSRKNSEIINSLWGFIKPLIVISFPLILLLAEPDLGTVIIVFLTTLSLLFILGVKTWKFVPTIFISVVIVIILIVQTPYRYERIMSFWNPWNDPFGKNYQLTQSLMALGRGNILGSGLGHSIQKLEYLPESHTDFIFSIIGEELGYIGCCIILCMIFFISFRAIKIGKKSFQNKIFFSGYLACSIGLWIYFQTLINIGTTIGVLPTKGLTLPLISYGGSSLTITFISIIILLRIDFELRLKNVHALKKNDI